MNKYRIDGLERFDVAFGVFFSRQLEAIRPGLFDIQYPELQGRKFLPINTSINTGAAEFTYRTYDRVGRAKLVADYGKDFPRIGLSAAEETVKIVSIGDSYGWSIQEARAAMMAGLDLDPRSARAARAAIEQKIDEILLVGDDDLEIEGLFTLSGTTTYTTTTGAAGDTEFSTKSTDEILLDLHSIGSEMYAATNGVEAPDTMIFPLDTYGSLTTLQVGNGDARTLLAKFLADDPHVKNVYVSHRLATAGASSSRRIVAYKKSPDVLEGLIPQEFEQFPPEMRSMEVITTCHARCGGVAVYRPKAISYADGV